MKMVRQSARLQWVTLSCLVLCHKWTETSTSATGGESGCADGTTDGLQDERHPNLAACDGRWEGHVGNATSLCASGWTVCGWDTADLLLKLTWREAMRLSGCYALNAAQDDGQCRPCVTDIHQDDLAGVGAGCPHRSYGTDSCISGGQMDVTCCRDAYFSDACTYRPGLVTGVLCCRLPGEVPKLVVRPAPVTHVQVGRLFVLSCQAVGSPIPRVRWLQDEREIPIDINRPRRIAAFESGYLIVSEVQLTDSATYKCVAHNSAGNATASALVIVTEYPSGCADESTDGLYQYEDIQACRGRWRGHVRRAKTLCAPGWQVCSPRHASLLKLLSWSDITQLDGCYAYNAANTLNLCSVCKQGDMAGVGRGCGRHRVGRRSCLADGLIDVHLTRSKNAGKCNYEEGLTTGTLCCKRPEKWQIGYRWLKPKCKPRCQNGGVCVANGRCRCAIGYKGALCQNPICPGGCIPNSVCVQPSTCRCLDGYSGPKCRPDHHHHQHPERVYLTRLKASTALSSSTSRPGSSGHPLTGSCRCLNGGRCVKNSCKCPPGYRGRRCRHVVDRHQHLTKGNATDDLPAEINRTEQ